MGGAAELKPGESSLDDTKFNGPWVKVTGSGLTWRET